MRTKKSKRRWRNAVSCLALAAILGAQEAAHAGDWDWDDITAPYTQRLDTQTSSSGNAQRVNTVTHVITPWPRNVRNRRIPANGERMVGAVRRYRDGGKERLPLMQKNAETSFEMTIEAPTTPPGVTVTNTTGTYNSTFNAGKPTSSASITSTTTQRQPTETTGDKTD